MAPRSTAQQWFLHAHARCTFHLAWSHGKRKQDWPELAATTHEKKKKVGDHALSQRGFGLGTPEVAEGGGGNAGQHRTRAATREGSRNLHETSSKETSRTHSISLCSGAWTDGVYYVIRVPYVTASRVWRSHQINCIFIVCVTSTGQEPGINHER
jgi:hypothetical protein